MIDQAPQSRQTCSQQKGKGREGKAGFIFHNKGMDGKPLAGPGLSKGAPVKGMGKDIGAKAGMQKAQEWSMKPGKVTHGGPGDQSWLEMQGWQGKQSWGEWRWCESCPQWSEHSAQWWDEGWREVTDSWTQTDPDEDRASRWRKNDPSAKPIGFQLT